MSKNNENKADPIVVTSIRIPKTVHQHWMQKSHALDLSLAKTLAYLLQQEQKQAPIEEAPDYGLLTYTLLQEAIHNFVENSQGLIDKALQKTESLQSALKSDPLS